MTNSNNINGSGKWQIFGVVYAAALLAGLPFVADWPGIAVGFLELIGVFVVYLVICAAATGVLIGMVYVSVYTYSRSLKGNTARKNILH